MQKKRYMKIGVLAAALAICAGTAAAQTDALRLIVSNGLKAVVVELQPQAERAIGHPLAMQFGTTAALKQKIETGEPFDAALITTDAIDALAQEGHIVSASRAKLARAGIGVGIQAGAAKPDIATPDGLKRALLGAKSITYAREGASRKHLDQMYGQLGIASAVGPKVVLTDGSAQSAARVAAGQSDMILTLVSEILPAPGVQLAGPLPKQLQSYIAFEVGISPHAQRADAAKALIRFLTASAAAPVFKAKGMEPR